MTSGRGVDATGIALGAGLAALYLVTLVSWALFPGRYRPEQPLEPYLTVVTDVEHSRAAAELLAAGAIDVITPQSTEVLVARFSRVESVSLTEALGTLDPLDPRRDPWIEGLSDWFSFHGRNAVYARFDRSVGRVDRLVRRVLGRSSRVAEWSPFRAGGALLILLGIVTVVLTVYGPGRMRLVPALVPWIPAVAAGGLVSAAVAGVSFIFVARAAEEGGRLLTLRRPHATSGLRRATRSHGWADHGILRFRLGALAAVMALSIIYAGRLAGWRSIVPLIIALVGSGAGAAAGVLAFRSYLDPDHRPFVPVSILARRSASIGAPRWTRLVPFVFPILLFAPILFDALIPGGIERPVTRLGSSASLTYDAILELWATPADSGLPDISDYLAHRAHQEGLLYGREYGFPGYGEAVELVRFREEADGSYSSYREAVLLFDEEWLALALNDAPRGLTLMLAELGVASGVVLAPVDTIYSGYPQFLQHLTYVVLVLAPLLLRAPSWARSIRSHGSILELARRRRQVA